MIAPKFFKWLEETHPIRHRAKIEKEDEDKKIYIMYEYLNHVYAGQYAQCILCLDLSVINVHGLYKSLKEKVLEAENE